MGVEEKIDILFYLFGIFMCFFVFSIGVNLKKQLFPRLLDRYSTNLSDWDSRGEHDSILENVDRYLKVFPGESGFHWAKARALFKTGKYTEAKIIFEEISNTEPMWKEDSDKYIETIEQKLSI